MAVAVFASGSLSVPRAVAAPTSPACGCRRFSIEVWADGVTNARSLARGERGTVFVGSRNAGSVYAIRDEGGTRRVFTIGKGLNMPNGVAFRDGALYVGELTRVLRYDAIESRLGSPPRRSRSRRCRASGIMAGATSPSARTTSSTSRSARPATSATAMPRAMARSSG